MFGLVWFGLVWFCLVWFGFVLFCFVLFCLVWFGLVWFGLVLFCFVWFGLVWFVREATIRNISMGQVHVSAIPPIPPHRVATPPLAHSGVALACLRLITPHEWWRHAHASKPSADDKERGTNTRRGRAGVRPI